MCFFILVLPLIIFSIIFFFLIVDNITCHSVVFYIILLLNDIKAYSVYSLTTYYYDFVSTVSDNLFGLILYSTFVTYLVVLTAEGIVSYEFLSLSISIIRATKGFRRLLFPINDPVN